MLDFNYEEYFDKIDIDILDSNKKYNFYIIGVCCYDCKKLEYFKAINTTPRNLKKQLKSLLTYDSYFYILTNINNLYYRIISQKEL